MSAQGTYRFYSVQRQTILLVNEEPLSLLRSGLSGCHATLHRGERCVTSRETAAMETRNPLAGEGLIVAFYKTVKYICKIVSAPKKNPF